MTEQQSLEISESWKNLESLVGSQNYGPSFTEGIKLLKNMGRTAVVRELRSNMPSPLIPSVLQSREYIEGLFRSVNVPAERFRTSVKIRLGRSSLMLKSGAKLDFIMSERALREGYGISNEGMVRQLDHILYITKEHPQVGVQVAPDALLDNRASPELFYPHGLAGPVHASHLADLRLPQLHLAPASVSIFETMWNEISEQALGLEESQTRIEEIKQELISSS